MKAPLRGLATLVCFLLLLGALVASGSGILDKWILILVWSAFLIGSIILVIKNARQPPDSRGSYSGQVSWLPHNWQRWILGEEKQAKGEARPHRRVR